MHILEDYCGISNKFALSSSFSTVEQGKSSILPKTAVDQKIFSSGEIILNGDTSGYMFIFSNHIEMVISTILSATKVVEKIFLLRSEDNNNFYVWATLSDGNKESRFQLYDKEQEIIELFLDLPFNFDFNIVVSGGEPNLIKSGAKLIYSRR